MRQRLAKALIFGAVFSMLAGCGKKTDDEHFDVYPEYAPQEMAYAEPVQKSSQEKTIGYKNALQAYTDIMLEDAGDENGLFSPESMNIALALYSKLTSDKGQEMTRSFIGDKDYLSFESTDVFRITNRLWVNEAQHLNLESLEDIKDVIYEMDMTDSGKATTFKNDYVKEQTNGFIDKTPTILHEGTIVDAMNIIYFKDTWKSGEKEVIPFEFTNSDGSLSYTYMMLDTGYRLKRGSNAYSYTMSYDGGYEFTVVLPDEGFKVQDIDITEFINDEGDYLENKGHLKMPEFETRNTYQLFPSQFNISDTDIRSDIYEGPQQNTAITQITKIVVDRKGTEAAAVTEITKTMDSMLIVDDKPKDIYLTCDRPFLYYITDTVNNDTAFIGVVNHIELDSEAAKICNKVEMDEPVVIDGYLAN